MMAQPVQFWNIKKDHNCHTYHIVMIKLQIIILGFSESYYSINTSSLAVPLYSLFHHVNQNIILIKPFSC